MVLTKIIKVNPKRIDISVLKKAASLIKGGELVAFPTETVYGLGADALNTIAVKKIFQVKGRPPDNPIIVHVSSKLMINDLTRFISKDALKLIDTFFPGPLTLIFKKSDKIPLETTGGLDTIAIRYPSNTIAQELIKLSETPIAAPSANISGKTSTTTAYDVYEDFKGKIPLIIDGGKTEIGLESTVVDVSEIDKVPLILRPGKITKTDIELCLGHSINQNQDIKVVRSPGMKYRHYAPDAKLIVLERGKAVIDYLKQSEDQNISIIINQTEFEEVKSEFQIHKIQTVYKYKTIEELGFNLFSKLREMDRSNVNLIIVQFNDKTDFGTSVYNRLKKAISK
jgi:L-threonylcarbamoyladenylate synthase